MMIGSMPVGGAQPANVVIGEVVAMIFACQTEMSVDAALGSAVIFSVFGTYVVTIVFTIASSFNAWCDDTCSKGETKGVTNAVLADVALLGGLFAVIAITAYVGGAAIQPAMESLSTNASSADERRSRCCRRHDAFRRIRRSAENHAFQRYVGLLPCWICNGSGYW